MEPFLRMEKFSNEVFSVERLTELSLDVLAAIAIGIVMFGAAKFGKGRINKIGLKHEELDETLFLFLGKIAYFLVLAGTINGEALLGSKKLVPVYLSQFAI